MQAYDRSWLRAQTVPGLHIVSVGNLQVGGTGKTPAVACLATIARKQGWRVCIVSRGYGRTTTAPLDFDCAALPSAEACGDEPRLLAQRCPGVRIFVDADRLRACLAARAQGFDLAILDDGFQHRRLARDCDVVVWPGPSRFTLPAGPNREPVAALGRATLLWVVGEAAAPSVAAPTVHVQGEVVTSRPTPPLSQWPTKVVLLTGIARPERVVDSLRRVGVQVVRHFVQADHQRFPAELVQEAQAEAARLGTTLVTTAKDVQRGDLGPVWVVDIQMSLSEADEARLCVVAGLVRAKDATGAR
jgi:tetraacyldisaccharide 4'-kinase